MYYLLEFQNSQKKLNLCQGATDKLFFLLVDTDKGWYIQFSYRPIPITYRYTIFHIGLYRNRYSISTVCPVGIWYISYLNSTMIQDHFWTIKGDIACIFTLHLCFSNNFLVWSSMNFRLKSLWGGITNMKIDHFFSQIRLYKTKCRQRPF